MLFHFFFLFFSLLSFLNWDDRTCIEAATKVCKPDKNITFHNIFLVLNYYREKINANYFLSVLESKMGEYTINSVILLKNIDYDVMDYRPYHEYVPVCRKGRENVPVSRTRQPCARVPGLARRPRWKQRSSRASGQVSSAFLPASSQLWFWIHFVAPGWSALWTITRMSVGYDKHGKSFYIVQ